MATNEKPESTNKSNHASISTIFKTLQERKAFINFTEADQRELVDLKTWGNAQVGNAADHFYDHLEKFDTPMGVIRQAGSTLDRLRDTLNQYLLELFDGEYDDRYFKRRYQIGVRHDLIGLTPRWYIGGYSIHFQNMVPSLVRRYWWRPKKLIRKLMALNKILNLDEQVAIDTYFDLRASKVASASTEIAQTAQEIAENTRQQSDHIARTSAAMEEMTATISQVSENASATLNAAQEATTRAQRGEVNIQEVVAGIDDANQTVQQLRQRAEAIGRVIELIQEIATQTDLLALNAAIEAAGAGEFGVRFNVVAEEVRRLARRTAESGSEITVLINQDQEDTQRAAAMIAQSTQMAANTKNAIGGIVTSITDLQSMVHQIAAAAEQQAHTTEDVANALTEIAQASQQITTATEQTALSTQDLSQMAERLKD